MNSYRKFLIFVLLLIMLLAACTPATLIPPKNQVLIILPEQSEDMDYMLTNEVGVMMDMLTKAGFKVVTASDSGQPLGSGNTALKPDLKIADVKVENYVGLIDPCLARPLEVASSPETLAIIKDAVAQGKVIAGQLGGVYEFYQAGVLKGKQYAYVEDNSSYFPDSIYKGEGIVQDGKIITGGVCPEMAKLTGKTDTTAELTQKFIDVLKLQ
jgi:putative intracellular protease/amidase